MTTSLFAILAVATLANTAMMSYLVINQKQKHRPRAGAAIVVDTCALIDGRICEIVRAGFSPAIIYIPSVVVRELQFLADKADSHKRERARFGLDIARELQTLKGVDVRLLETPIDDSLPVDDQLVAIATAHGAMLYTTDYNLNKVAEIKGVRVLNVNELAQGLRSSNLPGEKAAIKIVEKGQDKTQGVGYLDDGTMVVVERAQRKLGEVVEVTFTRVLQTHAGKMMFARLHDASTAVKQSKPSVGRSTQRKPANGNTRNSSRATNTRASSRQSKPSQEDVLLDTISKQR